MPAELKRFPSVHNLVFFNPQNLCQKTARNEFTRVLPTKIGLCPKVIAARRHHKKLKLV